MRSTFLVVALTIALAGCVRAQRVEVTTQNGDDFVWHQGVQGEVTITCREPSGLVRKAVLERAQGSGSDRTIYRVVELDPPAIDDASFGWLFAYLPPTTDLVFPDARIVEHPDRAVAQDLTRHLEASPPDVATLLQGLAWLHRLESRAPLAVRAANLAQLDDASFELLVDAVTRGANGPLFAPGPQARPAGGSTGDALQAIVDALSKRRDLGTARAERLIPATASLSFDRRGTILARLAIDHGAATAPILQAAAQLHDSNVRLRLLSALANARGGSESDAVAIAQASGSLGSSGTANVLSILVALDALPTRTALEVIARIYDSNDRARLVKALARARGKTAADADAIAQTTGSFGSAHGREVLLLLIEAGGISTAAAVTSASRIYDSSERARVLEALAEKRGAVAADASRVAQASVSLGSSEHARLLLTLEKSGGVPALELADLASRIYDSTQRARVLEAVASREHLDATATTRVLVVSGSLGSAEHARVLLILARGGAPTKPLVDAARRIHASDQRARTLVELAKQRGAERVDGDTIAAGSDGLGSADELLVIETLVQAGGASTDALVGASKKIHGSDARARALLAIARRAELSGAEADRICAAAAGLDSRNQADVLISLVGRASRDALIATAKTIWSSSERERVLERLARNPATR